MISPMATNREEDNAREFIGDPEDCWKSSYASSRARGNCYDGEENPCTITNSLLNWDSYYVPLVTAVHSHPA